MSPWKQDWEQYDENMQHNYQSYNTPGWTPKKHRPTYINNESQDFTGGKNFIYSKAIGTTQDRLSGQTEIIGFTILMKRTSIGRALIVLADRTSKTKSIS